VKSYDKLAQAEQMVMIGAFAFVYLIVMVICDVLRVKSRYFPNLDLWEFACDGMFSILLFGAAISLAVKCNKSVAGTKTCKYDFSGNGGIVNNNYYKTSASEVCPLLLRGERPNMI